MSDAPSDAGQRFLLLDDHITEQTNNVALVMGTVHKHPANPLFDEDNPWEHRFDNLYANVIFDEAQSIYKCWYSPFIVDHTSLGMPLDKRYDRKYEAPRNREMGICYATSEDGVTWIKPEMGLVDYEGSTANNILWRGVGTPSYGWHGPHGTGTFKDLQESDPARR